MAVSTIGSIGQELNLLIRQGGTFGPCEVTLTNPDGSAVDLTGSTLRAQLRQKALDSGTPVATFTITVTDATGGVFTFGLSDEITAGIACGETRDRPESRYQWDLELEDLQGRVTPLLYGMVTVWREVTRV